MKLIENIIECGEYLQCLCIYIHAMLRFLLVLFLHESVGRTWGQKKRKNKKIEIEE